MQADLAKAACSFSGTVDGVILVVGLHFFLMGVRRSEHWNVF